jgi:hypothetical protein
MVFSNKGGLFAPQGSSMLMPRDTKRNFILPSMKISEGIQPQLIKVADDRIQNQWITSKSESQAFSPSKYIHA